MMWISYIGKEWIRKKIGLVTFVLTLLFAGLFSYGSYEIAKHALDEPNPNALLNGMMLMALGLLFAQMIIAFLILFATMGAISGEVENGQMLAVLARPIPRWKVYLGKYMGSAAWLIVYSIALYLAILLPVHHWLNFPLDAFAILKSLLLFIWAPLLLLALSMLGSVYLPMLGNGVACALLYGLSMFSGFVENIFTIDGDGNGGNATASQISLFFSMLMPSNAMLRRVTYELFAGLDLPIPADMINSMGPFSTVNVPSMAFVGYTVIYFIVLLAIGCMAFKRKDIA
ncbi:ABC transporter permease [Paenibacillus silvisoli]|uniref:ABC transporter permease n=1 Tax=Paenibacillus silvisoli TaxID=3110539 RepID=UPI0028043073|nr:ABC transporter permease subunit [Paenibacillus silvisoli]